MESEANCVCGDAGVSSWRLVSVMNLGPPLGALVHWEADHAVEGQKQDDHRVHLNRNGPQTERNKRKKKERHFIGLSSGIRNGRILTSNVQARLPNRPNEVDKWPVDQKS